MTKRLLTTLIACLLAASGCNLIYKQNIQQGNALEQEDLDELRLGMSMNQVAFLLGTPSIRDPFHHERWDYVSSFSRRGGEPIIRTITLRFESGALVEMIGIDDAFPLEEDDLGDNSDEVETVEQTPAEIVGDPVEETANQTEPTGPVETVAESVESAAVVTALEAPEIDEVEFTEPEATEAPTLETDIAADETVPNVVTPPVETEPVPAPEALLEDPALSGEVAGTWLIQLGAFASAENAENLVEILAEAGFDAGIITQQVQNLGNRYLVRHGGLETQAEAEALLEKINSELGVSGYVIPPS